MGQEDYYLHSCQEPLDYDWIGTKVYNQLLEERGYESVLCKSGWK